MPFSIQKKTISAERIRIIYYLYKKVYLKNPVNFILKNCLTFG